MHLISLCCELYGKCLVRLSCSKTAYTALCFWWKVVVYRLGVYVRAHRWIWHIYWCSPTVDPPLGYLSADGQPVMNIRCLLFFFRFNFVSSSYPSTLYRSLPLVACSLSFHSSTGWPHSFPYKFFMPLHAFSFLINITFSFSELQYLYHKYSPQSLARSTVHQECPNGPDMRRYVHIVRDFAFFCLS